MNEFCILRMNTLQILNVLWEFIEAIYMLCKLSKRKSTAYTTVPRGSTPTSALRFPPQQCKGYVVQPLGSPRLFEV